MNSELSVSAAYWNKLHKSGWLNQKTRWWQCDAVLRHINKNICGQPLDGITSGDIALLKKRYPGRCFKKAISIGCGNGLKELELIKSGLVAHFDLFEISQASIEQGQQYAAAAGLTDSMSFHQTIVELAEPARTAAYDLVYWNNALHHMLNVNDAIRWSKEQLHVGGVLYINDFVGPDRMEWSPEMLRIASAARSCLPSRMLRHPVFPWRKLPVNIAPVDIEKVIAIDPTECADSSRIQETFRNYFKNGLILPTGGLIYHTALNDVIKNIHEHRDSSILKLLLMMDDMTIAQGLTQYCVLVGDKKQVSLEYDHEE